MRYRDSSRNTFSDLGCNLVGIVERQRRCPREMAEERVEEVATIDEELEEVIRVVYRSLLPAMRLRQLSFCACGIEPERATSHSKRFQGLTVGKKEGSERKG